MPELANPPVGGSDCCQCSLQVFRIQLYRTIVVPLSLNEICGAPYILVPGAGARTKPTASPFLTAATRGLLRFIVLPTALTTSVPVSRALGDVVSPTVMLDSMPCALETVIAVTPAE